MTPEQAQIAAAIAALEAQRATLGDAVLELATAPLRARLAGLLRPAGLQHRQVTVLFADVVGSTALAQGMDAEETLAILSAGLCSAWPTSCKPTRAACCASRVTTSKARPNASSTTTCCTK